MPKIARGKTRYPEGWDQIEPTLKEFEKKFRDAENESHEGKRKVEASWPIYKLHHQRSRYVYEIYYKRHVISKELYDFLLENGYADGQLIAKWKKPRDTNFGTACICRVPKTKLDADKVIECVFCGCRGCCG